MRSSPLDPTSSLWLCHSPGLTTLTKPPGVWGSRWVHLTGFRAHHAGQRASSHTFLPCCRSCACHCLRSVIQSLGSLQVSQERCEALLISASPSRPGTALTHSVFLASWINLSHQRIYTTKGWSLGHFGSLLTCTRMHLEGHILLKDRKTHHGSYIDFYRLDLWWRDHRVVLAREKPCSAPVMCSCSVVRNTSDVAGKFTLLCVASRSKRFAPDIYLTPRKPV